MGGAADVGFSYAFQPIVDIEARSVWSYEALIRGQSGESAASVFARVPASERHEFDRNGRMRALEIAGRLGTECSVNLNALPGSLADGTIGALRTVSAAQRAGLVPQQLVLEVTESEAIEDLGLLCTHLDAYRAKGVRIALDDFGSGYAGLNVLAALQPDILKLDMSLVREVECHGARQSIVRAILQVSIDLGIDVVAEGVETMGEYEWLAEHGIVLFQGYLFAKPALEALPEVDFPSLQRASWR